MLKSLHICGFKSFDPSEGQSFDLEKSTLFIGKNGSGKSNIISAIDMLRWIAVRKLVSYYKYNGLNNIMYYGSDSTKTIEIKIAIEDEGLYTYEVTLPFSMDGNLFVGAERIGEQTRCENKDDQSNKKDNVPIVKRYLDADRKGESCLKDDASDAAKVVYNFISRMRTYQFIDTSSQSRIRNDVYVYDSAELHRDGGNLAAVLKVLKEHPPYAPYYERILRHIRTVLPQFHDFDFRPLPTNPNYVRLNWKDSSGSEYLFGPHQLSDGSLRFMALATLLLQPPEMMPSLIALDEPELGLHPEAILDLGAMIGMARRYAQVLVAMQSPVLLDSYSADEVVVVERDSGANRTLAKKLESRALKAWLSRYTLSTLWEKNVLGVN